MGLPTADDMVDCALLVSKLDCQARLLVRIFEVGKQQYFGPYQQHYYKQIKILFSAMTMCVY